MLDWTLQHGATTQSLADWGADASASLQLMSQAPSSLTLHFPGMMDVDFPFAWLDKVILRAGDTIVFVGHAMNPQRDGAGENEGISIEFRDPWFFLQLGNISQTIYDGGQSTTSRTGTVTATSTSVTLADATGVAVGMTIVGIGIPRGTTITAISGLVLTISAAATASGTPMLRFIAGSPSSVYALFARIIYGSGFVPLAVSDTLSEIIQACDIHAGTGRIQFGGASGTAFALTPYPLDVKGTFETALRAALCFCADAQSYFDYTTDPPSLYFVTRATAPVKSLSFANGTIQTRQMILPRYDLLLTGARVVYQYYLVDGSPAMAVDAAGATSGLGVIQVEFDLAPPGSTPQPVPAIVEKQSLETELVDVSELSWWFANGNTGANAVGDIAFAPGKTPAYMLDLDPDAPENEGVDPGTDPGGFNKRIMSGAIPAWMNTASHVKYVRARAWLAVRTWQDPDDESKGYTFDVGVYTVRFAATDLAGGDYENTVQTAQIEGGTFDPETVPSGIAAEIMAAQGVLQYQGEVELTNDDCDLSWHPGQLLNISSGRTEWAAMKAQVQGVRHLIQQGVTTLTFGPAEHLAPQDYLEMARRIMRLKPALTLDNRANGGSAPPTQTINHPDPTDRSGSEVSAVTTSRQAKDSAGSISETTSAGTVIYTYGTTTIEINAGAQLISIQNGSSSIDLDLGAIPDGTEVFLQQVDFCNGGVTKSAWVLMSEPE